MKWQTLSLANGMEFNVWGPRSARKNDLTMLYRSKIEAKVEDIQRHRQKKIRIYGDSAYWDSEYLRTGLGRGMAAIRECIEWEYKDIKSQWKYCDYAHVLKVRKQPVAKIIFIAMLLKNAYVTMNANQTAEYYMMEPPTLEHWLSQGPRARPIPDDSPFSPNYTGDSDDDEFSDDTSESEHSDVERV